MECLLTSIFEQCMSQGLKNLQQAARPYARREHFLQATNITYDYQYADDSGIGLADLEAQYDDDGASKPGDSPAQSASTLYTDSGFRSQSTGGGYGSQISRPGKVSKLAGMDMGIGVVGNWGGSITPQIQVAAENRGHEATGIQSVFGSGHSTTNFNRFPRVRQERGREHRSPSLEESVNADETILPAAEIICHKMVPSPSTALSINSDDVQSTDHQELSTSQQNGCSSDESSCDRDAETKSECSCQEMANEATRQYTALLRWTSVLRRGLLHRLMNEFYKRFSEGDVRSFAASGEPSTRRASTSDSPTSTSEAVSSEPGSANRSNTSPGSQKRPADDDPEDDQDDKSNRKK